MPFWHMTHEASRSPAMLTWRPADLLQLRPVSHSGAKRHSINDGRGVGFYEFIYLTASASHSGRPSNERHAVVSFPVRVSEGASSHSPSPSHLIVYCAGIDVTRQKPSQHGSGAAGRAAPCILSRKLCVLYHHCV